MQVERKGRDVDVPGPFAVPEDAPFNSFGACQNGKFGTRDPGATVIVRMHGQNHAVAARQVAVHVLDLIGIHIRCRDLDGRRQVEDHRTVRAGVP